MGRLKIEDWQISYFLAGLMLSLGVMTLIAGNWQVAVGCFCASLGWLSAAEAEEKLSVILEKQTSVTSDDALNSQP
jgi:hypothetical protein